MRRKLLLLAAAIACSVFATQATAQITPNTGTQSREQQRTQEKAQLREELESREARYYVDVRQYGVGFHPSNDTAESMGAFQRALDGSACIARTMGEHVDKALGAKPMMQARANSLSELGRHDEAAALFERLDPRADPGADAEKRR